MDKKLKAQLFWGYIDYVQRKGKEAIHNGTNPNVVIKLKNYLMEELNYTEEEANQIQKELRGDSIDERKDKNRK